MTSNASSLPGCPLQRKVPTSSVPRDHCHPESTAVAVVRHSGKVHVRGKIRWVWRPRFLELLDNGQIQYYELPTVTTLQTSSLGRTTTKETHNLSNSTSVSSFVTVEREDIFSVEEDVHDGTIDSKDIHDTNASRERKACHDNDDRNYGKGNENFDIVGLDGGAKNSHEFELDNDFNHSDNSDIHRFLPDNDIRNAINPSNNAIKANNASDPQKLELHLPKCTLTVINESSPPRILDVTRLRDMHVGLPRGTYGFVFRATKEQVSLQNQQPQQPHTLQKTQQPIQMTTAQVDNNYDNNNNNNNIDSAYPTGAPINSSATTTLGLTLPSIPRDYICAVSTLEEAQMWVVALQWAASVTTITSVSMSSLPTSKLVDKRHLSSIHTTHLTTDQQQHKHQKHLHNSHHLLSDIKINGENASQTGGLSSRSSRKSTSHLSDLSHGVQRQQHQDQERLTSVSSCCAQQRGYGNTDVDGKHEIKALVVCKVIKYRTVRILHPRTTDAVTNAFETRTSAIAMAFPEKESIKANYCINPPYCRHSSTRKSFFQFELAYEIHGLRLLVINRSDKYFCSRNNNIIDNNSPSTSDRTIGIDHKVSPTTTTATASSALKVEQQDWTMLRTADDFQLLITDLCKELGPTVLDRSQLGLIQQLPRWKDSPTPAAMYHSVGIVDSILRSLVLDSDIFNSVAMQDFLGISSSDHPSSTQPIVKEPTILEGEQYERFQQNEQGEQMLQTNDFVHKSMRGVRTMNESISPSGTDTNRTTMNLFQEFLLYSMSFLTSWPLPLGLCYTLHIPRSVLSRSLKTRNDIFVSDGCDDQFGGDGHQTDHENNVNSESSRFRKKFNSPVVSVSSVAPGSTTERSKSLSLEEYAKQWLLQKSSLSSQCKTDVGTLLLQHPIWIVVGIGLTSVIAVPLAHTIVYVCFGSTSSYYNHSNTGTADEACETELAVGMNNRRLLFLPYYVASLIFMRIPKAAAVVIPLRLDFLLASWVGAAYLGGRFRQDRIRRSDHPHPKSQSQGEQQLENVDSSHQQTEQHEPHNTHVSLSKWLYDVIDVVSKTSLTFVSAVVRVATTIATSGSGFQSPSTMSSSSDSLSYDIWTTTEKQQQIRQIDQVNCRNNAFISPSKRSVAQQSKSHHSHTEQAGQVRQQQDLSCTTENYSTELIAISATSQQMHIPGVSIPKKQSPLGIIGGDSLSDDDIFLSSHDTHNKDLQCFIDSSSDDDNDDGDDDREEENAFTSTSLNSASSTDPCHVDPHQLWSPTQNSHLLPSSLPQYIPGDHNNDSFSSRPSHCWSQPLVASSMSTSMTEPGFSSSSSNDKNHNNSKNCIVTFHVRGASYLQDRVKVPSGRPAFRCRGVDIWMTDNPERHISRHPSMLGGTLYDEDTFLVNFLLPFGNVVAYFGIPPLEKFPNDKIRTVWKKFLEGDQQYRDARLKLLPVVTDGPWIVKTAVGPGKSPALLGKVIPLQYYFEHPTTNKKSAASSSSSSLVAQAQSILDKEKRNVGMYEVDVIITASTIAKGILSIVKGHTKSVTIALAFIIEASEEDELPETVLCSCMIHSINLEQCPDLPPFPTHEHHNRSDT